MHNLDSEKAPSDYPAEILGFKSVLEKTFIKNKRVAKTGML